MSGNASNAPSVSVTSLISEILLMCAIQAAQRGLIHKDPDLETRLDGGIKTISGEPRSRPFLHDASRRGAQSSFNMRKEMHSSPSRKSYFQRREPPFPLDLVSDIGRVESCCRDWEPRDRRRKRQCPESWEHSSRRREMECALPREFYGGGREREHWSSSDFNRLQTDHQYVLPWKPNTCDRRREPQPRPWLEPHAEKRKFSRPIESPRNNAPRRGLPSGNYRDPRGRGFPPDLESQDRLGSVERCRQSSKTERDADRGSLQAPWKRQVVQGQFGSQMLKEVRGHRQPLDPLRSASPDPLPSKKLRYQEASLLHSPRKTEEPCHEMKNLAKTKNGDCVLKKTFSDISQFSEHRQDGILFREGLTRESFEGFGNSTREALLDPPRVDGLDAQGDMYSDVSASTEDRANRSAEHQAHFSDISSVSSADSADEDEEDSGRQMCYSAITSTSSSVAAAQCRYSDVTSVAGRNCYSDVTGMSPDATTVKFCFSDITSVAASEESETKCVDGFSCASPKESERKCLDNGSHAAPKDVSSSEIMEPKCFSEVTRGSLDKTQRRSSSDVSNRSPSRPDSTDLVQRGEGPNRDRSCTSPNSAQSASVSRVEQTDFSSKDESSLGTPPDVYETRSRQNTVSDSDNLCSSEVAKMCGVETVLETSSDVCSESSSKVTDTIRVGFNARSDVGSDSWRSASDALGTQAEQPEPGDVGSSDHAAVAEGGGGDADSAGEGSEVVQSETLKEVSDRFKDDALFPDGGVRNGSAAGQSVSMQRHSQTNGQSCSDTPNPSLSEITNLAKATGPSEVGSLNLPVLGKERDNGRNVFASFGLSKSRKRRHNESSSDPSTDEVLNFGGVFAPSGLSASEGGSRGEGLGRTPQTVSTSVSDSRVGSKFGDSSPSEKKENRKVDVRVVTDRLIHLFKQPTNHAKVKSQTDTWSHKGKLSIAKHKICRNEKEESPQNQKVLNVTKKLADISENVIKKYSTKDKLCPKDMVGMKEVKISTEKDDRAQSHAGNPAVLPVRRISNILDYMQHSSALSSAPVPSSLARRVSCPAKVPKDCDTSLAPPSLSRMRDDRKGIFTIDWSELHPEQKTRPSVSSSGAPRTKAKTLPVKDLPVLLKSRISLPKPSTGGQNVGQCSSKTPTPNVTTSRRSQEDLETLFRRLQIGKSSAPWAVKGSGGGAPFSESLTCMVQQGLEEGEEHIADTLGLLEDLSQSFVPPPRLLWNILCVGVVGSTKRRTMFSCESTVKRVWEQHPGCVFLDWEVVLHSLRPSSGCPILNQSLLVELVISGLTMELATHDPTSLQDLRRSVLYQTLGGELLSNLKLLYGHVTYWLATCQELLQATHSSEAVLVPSRPGQSSAPPTLEKVEVTRRKMLLPGLFRLLELGINASRSCTDTAGCLAREMVKSYIYLPDLERKRLFLELISSPLLCFKVVQQILEEFCTNTIKCCLEFPACPVEVVEAFAATLPPRNPITPPQSPTSLEEGVQEEQTPWRFSAGCVEELAMLVFYVVKSYLATRTGQLFKPLHLRRRTESSGGKPGPSCQGAVLRLKEHILGLNAERRDSTLRYLHSIENMLL